MSGFFGVASKGNCVTDLFYGTDYHSHLGTRRGGMAVRGHDGIERIIHDITASQFRSKFQNDVLTTLRYQLLDDLIEAIGLPREKLCTFCWSGEDHTGQFHPTGMRIEK